MKIDTTKMSSREQIVIPLDLREDIKKGGGDVEKREKFFVNTSLKNGDSFDFETLSPFKESEPIKVIIIDILTKLCNVINCKNLMCKGLMIEQFMYQVEQLGMKITPDDGNIDLSNLDIDLAECLEFIFTLHIYLL